MTRLPPVRLKTHVKRIEVATVPAKKRGKEMPL